jgi:hypothetical protein
MDNKKVVLSGNPDNKEDDYKVVVISESYVKIFDWDCVRQESKNIFLTRDEFEELIDEYNNCR